MNNPIKKLALVSVVIASPLLWLLNNKVSATAKPRVAESILSQAATPQDKWRRMSEKEEINQIKSLIDSPMGVAALNQLASLRFYWF